MPHVRPEGRLHCTPEQFEDEPLLALVLDEQPDSSLPRRILRRFGHLGGLPTRSVRELASVSGLGRQRALRLLASFELGLRAVRYQAKGPSLVCSQQVYERFQHLAVLRKETFWVVALDVRNRVLHEFRVAEGALNACTVVARDVFRPVVQEGAARAIILHNHPSGDPTPSPEDVALTRQLAQAGDLLGVQLLDHLIIGAGRYTSLAESGLFDIRSPSPASR